MTVPMPPGLLASRGGAPDRDAWLDRLPRLVDDLLDEWGLVPDGDAMHGQCAVVVPVRDGDGGPQALKVSWPHDEQEHEHLALRRWSGDGTVLLRRADPARAAMLLERLDAGRDLTAVPVLEACEVVAGLYARLHVPALPQLRTLTSYVGRWTERLAVLPTTAPLPRRLVDQAVALGRAFTADPGSDGVLIHGDLHYENVLAADREAWLVIDPKPVSGDPHYEVAPMLWNRWDEVLAAHDPRLALRLRFETVVDVGGLDEDRARDWVVVRMLHNALWCLEDCDFAPDADDRSYLTMCVTIAKAVQG